MTAQVFLYLATLIVSSFYLSTPRLFTDRTDNINVIENCYSVMTITGKVECGGIVAVSESKSIVNNCYALSTINSTDKNKSC